MVFGQLNYLPLIFCIPIVVAILIFGFCKRQRLLSTFISCSLWKRVVPSLSLDRRFWRYILWVLGFSFLFVALLRPQYGVKYEKLVRRGLDIYIAIDVSKSMLVKDVKPSRFDFAKQEILSLIHLLKGDRIGLVSFSGEAFIQCPLTLDYGAIQMFLDDIEVGSIPVPGTDIATAIKKARVSFKTKSSSTEKILILLTDGESFENDPIHSAEVAGKEGIKIYTIGIGTSSGEPIPETNQDGDFMGYKKDQSGNVILSTLNETLLKRISAVTGGEYFSIQSSYGVMTDVYRYLSQKDKMVQSEQTKKMYVDRYAIFLVISLLFFVAEFLLSERKKS